MLTKKTIISKGILFIFTMSVLFVIVACGSSETESNNATNSPSNDSSADSSQSIANAADGNEPVEIEFWYSFGGTIEENNLNLVEMFNNSQDEVIVTAHNQGDYENLHQSVQAAFVAGHAPEVTLNEIAAIGIFARNGLTQPLDEFIERDNIDVDDFIDGLMGNSYVDGNLYGIPYLRSTPILYMNVDMLKEAGLDPAGPKNWDEFEEYARKLTIPGEQVGISMPVGIWFFEAFVAQAGGQMLSDDGKAATFAEAGVEVLDLWKRMVSEGTMKVPVGDDAGDVANQDFDNQISGMKFASTANLTSSLAVAEGQGYELNTAFMPGGSAGYGVPTGGANLVMTAGLEPEKQEAAWKFLKWMTEKEQTIYASTYTGYLATRNSAIESNEIQDLYEEVPQYKVAMDQLEYGRPRPMEEAYAEIMNVIVTEMQRAIIDDSVTSETAMETAVERANALLNQ